MVKLGIVKSYFINFTKNGIFMRVIDGKKSVRKQRYLDKLGVFYLTMERYFVKFKNYNLR